MSPKINKSTDNVSSQQDCSKHSESSFSRNKIELLVLVLTKRISQKEIENCLPPPSFWRCPECSGRNHQKWDKVAQESTEQTRRIVIVMTGNVWIPLVQKWGIARLMVTCWSTFRKTFWSLLKPWNVQAALCCSGPYILRLFAVLSQAIQAWTVFSQRKNTSWRRLSRKKDDLVGSYIESQWWDQWKPFLSLHYGSDTDRKFSLSEYHLPHACLSGKTFTFLVFDAQALFSKQNSNLSNWKPRNTLLPCSLEKARKSRDSEQIG